MSEREIKLPRDLAERILGCEAVCHSEGIGPDITELLEWIRNTYPELAAQYSWLYRE
jgi:hypothetical protein